MFSCGLSSGEYGGKGLRDHKAAAVMVASTIHKEQNVRPRILFGQSVQEDLKAFRICCRQDQEHTRPIFGTYRSIQIGELPNELAGDFGSYPLGSPTRSRAVHPTEPSFLSKHNSQRATLGSSKTTSLGHRGSKPFFLKSFCASRSRSG